MNHLRAFAEMGLLVGVIGDILLVWPTELGLFITVVRFAFVALDVALYLMLVTTTWDTWFDRTSLYVESVPTFTTFAIGIPGLALLFAFDAASDALPPLTVAALAARIAMAAFLWPYFRDASKWRPEDLFITWWRHVLRRQ